MISELFIKQKLEFKLFSSPQTLCKDECNCGISKSYDHDQQLVLSQVLLLGILATHYQIWQRTSASLVIADRQHKSLLYQ